MQNTYRETIRTLILHIKNTSSNGVLLQFSICLYTTYNSVKLLFNFNMLSLEQTFELMNIVLSLRLWSLLQEKLLKCTIPTIILLQHSQDAKRRRTSNTSKANYMKYKLLSVKLSL